MEMTHRTPATFPRTFAGRRKVDHLRRTHATRHPMEIKAAVRVVALGACVALVGFLLAVSFVRADLALRAIAAAYQANPQPFRTASSGPAQPGSGKRCCSAASPARDLGRLGSP